MNTPRGASALATGTGLIAIITAMVSLGPLATDMYLPALPALTSDLNANVAQVQLTLSVFLFGFAFAQLLYGPLADRFGRRPVVIGGLLVFLVATAGCAQSESIEALIFWRLLQALGGSAGPVLGRAMVRDIYGPRDAGRVLSYVGAAMGLAPALAPIVGGYLIVLYGWQAPFVMLALYGLVMLLIVYTKLPETLAAELRQPFELLPTLRNYRRLLSDRVFVGHCATLACMYGALFAFISGSSFVIVDYFGVAQQHFGYYFTILVAGYIGGTFAGGKLSHRYTGHQLLRAGSWLALLAAALMVAISVIELYQLVLVMVSVALCSAAVGIIMPQAMAGGLAPYPQMAGTAASAMGFIQMITAGLAGVAVGHFHDGSPAPMLLVTAAMAVLAALGYRILVGDRALA